MGSGLSQNAFEPLIIHTVTHLSSFISQITGLVFFLCETSVVNVDFCVMQWSEGGPLRLLGLCRVNY